MKSNKEICGKRHYGHYKSSAKRRNYCFELTYDQFTNLTEQPCFYCGDTFSKVFKKNSACEAYLVNGLDRINNKVGYIPDNVVSCCKWCNTAKLDMDVDDYIRKIKQVAAFMVEMDF